VTLSSGDSEEGSFHCTRINGLYFVYKTLKKGEFDETKKDLTVGADGLITID